LEALRACGRAGPCVVAVKPVVRCRSSPGDLDGISHPSSKRWDRLPLMSSPASHGSSNQWDPTHAREAPNTAGARVPALLFGSSFRAATVRTDSIHWCE